VDQILAKSSGQLTYNQRKGEEGSVVPHEGIHGERQDAGSRGGRDNEEARGGHH
jgi:hypothetical protein